MFKQISGNPTSITMIAAMQKNPLIKKENQNSLIDMYDRIKSHKDIVVRQIGEEDKQDSVGIKAHGTRVYKNVMSLQISTQMNVKMLEKTKPKDMALLYFLGCLPGGCKED